MRGFTRNCGNVTPKAALCKSACVAVLVCICLRNVMCLFSCACYFFMSCACVSLVVGCHLSASFYLLVVSLFFILNVEVISAIFIFGCVMLFVCCHVRAFVVSLCLYHFSSLLFIVMYLRHFICLCWLSCF